MMDTEIVSGKVKAIILKHFPLAKTRGLSNDDGLLESGILDSLGVLDLVSHLENAFNITVSDDELLPQNFHSVTSLTQYIQMKCNHTIK